MSFVPRQPTWSANLLQPDIEMSSPALAASLTATRFWDGCRARRSWPSCGRRAQASEAAQRSAAEEGRSHWGAQGCQPCWRFWAQSLIACSRVSSLRFYRCAEGCA